MPMLVSAGSISTAATSPCASSRSSPARSLNSATRLVSVTSHGRADVAGRETPLAVGADHDQRLVDAAVVAVAVDQDLRPAGQRAHQPDRPAVGVGGGQREAPPGQAEPPRQLRAHPRGVLGRHHRGEAAASRDLPGHRVDHGLRRVPGHRAGVAEARSRRTRGRRCPSPARRGPGRGTAGSRRRSCSSTSSAPGRTGGARPRSGARTSGGARAYDARSRVSSSASRRRSTWSWARG